MKTNLKKHLMNSVGIAIVAMLLGSNIGYAIDNYGILVNNLSFAVAPISSADTPSGTNREELDTEWYTTDKNNEVVQDVDKCDMKVYARRQVPEWEKREASFSFQSTSEWSIEVGAQWTENPLRISHGDFHFKRDKDKIVKISVTYERPVCADNDYNCCKHSHMEKPLICLFTTAEVPN